MSSKHVAIIGGSSGIGLATAAHLLEKGYRVTITGRDAAKLRAAAQNLDGDVATLAVDQGGRLELFARQLRVGVDVTAGGDEAGYAQREQMVELEGQGLGPGRRLRPGRCQRAARRQRQRTRHVEFSITRDGWIIGENSRQPRPPAVTLRNVFRVAVGPRSVTNALVGGPEYLRDSR